MSIRKADWSEVQAHLALAPNTDPTVDLEYFREELEAGRAGAWGVYYGWVHVGSFMACVLEGNKGAELVIMIAGADDPKANVTQYSFPAYEQLARRMDCQVIRFNTCRRGIRHEAEQAGYKMQDYVMRKAVAA